MLELSKVGCEDFVSFSEERRRRGAGHFGSSPLIMSTLVIKYYPKLGIFLWWRGLAKSLIVRLFKGRGGRVRGIGVRHILFMSEFKPLFLMEASFISYTCLAWNMTNLRISTIATG